ncbi:MAG: hypothetical protein KIC77_01745 [Clostridiales bacterium]|jgi:hypothetical protein|nr:hypothetical protein [Clostridiales bacterium]
MIRRRRLPAILLVGVLASILLFAGCKSTEKGVSTWTTNGGDPSFKKQEEVSADKLVQFGVYPQKKADSKIQSDIKSKVTIDEETGLWNECDDETMYAKYDLETGYFIYAPKVEGVKQAEQYYMGCGDDLYLVEPLQWIVLETNGSDSIIISNKVIDGGRKYNNLYGECNWINSSMRNWLNGTDEYDVSTGEAYKTELNFLNRAFTDNEISKIKSVNITTGDNEIYGTDGGGSSTDKIYFLSASEFEKYFKTEGSEFNATAYATDYAKARGVAAGKDSDANWWLRDPGAITYMLGVNRAGVVTEGGFSVHDMTEGVRPVLRVPSSALQKVEVQTNK